MGCLLPFEEEEEEEEEEGEDKEGEVVGEEGGKEDGDDVFGSVLVFLLRRSLEAPLSVKLSVLGPWRDLRLRMRLSLLLLCLFLCLSSDVEEEDEEGCSGTDMTFTMRENVINESVPSS